MNSKPIKLRHGKLCRAVSQSYAVEPRKNGTAMTCMGCGKSTIVPARIAE